MYSYFIFFIDFPLQGDIAFRFIKYVDDLQGAFTTPVDPQAFNIDIPDGVTQGAFGVNEGVAEEARETPTASEATQSHVTVCDINPEMLQVGRKRASAKSIQSGQFLIILDLYVNFWPFVDV